MRKILFVDDEESILKGLQRMLRSKRKEWDMRFATSARQALDFMAADEPEVLVTDMRMPQMNGAELLEQTKDRHPNTIRIVLSGQSELESVYKLVNTAHQYLSKPCEAPVLVEAVDRMVTLQKRLSNERLKVITSNLDNLPSLPAIFQEISRELAKEDASIQSVAKIIEKDIAMSAKILKLVNSAFFGLPRHVNSPAEAATILGLEIMRNLVLASQVFTEFENADNSGFNFDSLMQRSLLVGNLAAKLAKAHCDDKRLIDHSFIAGILHDIGVLIMAAFMPEEFSAIIARKGGPYSYDEAAESEIIGQTHMELGAYLLGVWGLPVPVVEAVGYHHCPSLCNYQEYAPLSNVHLADTLVRHLNDEVNSLPQHFDQAYLSHLGREFDLSAWHGAAKRLSQGERV